MSWRLDEAEIVSILEHWNGTKANAYRGSGYGENHNRMLFQNMSMDHADQIIDKIKQDIPLFANLDSETLKVMSEDLENDVKAIYIVVGSAEIMIGTTDNSNYTGDTFYANAQ